MRTPRVITGVACLLALAVSLQAQVYLRNNSFSYATPLGTPYYWDILTDQIEVTVDSTTYVSAPSALKAVGDSAMTYQLISQNIANMPAVGEEYTASAKINVMSLAPGAAVEVAVHFAAPGFGWEELQFISPEGDTSNGWQGAALVRETTDGWLDVSATDTVPEGAGKAVLRIQVMGELTAYVDDVKFNDQEEQEEPHLSVAPHASSAAHSPVALDNNTLRLPSAQAYTLQVFDLNGRQLYRTTGQARQVNLPVGLRRQTICVSLTTEAGEQRFRLMPY